MSGAARGLGKLLDGIAVTRPEVERYVALLTARRGACSWEGTALRVTLPADLAQHAERVRASLKVCYSSLVVIVEVSQ